jgi:hypothetical protein
MWARRAKNATSNNSFGLGATILSCAFSCRPCKLLLTCEWRRELPTRDGGRAGGVRNHSAAVVCTSTDCTVVGMYVSESLIRWIYSRPIWPWHTTDSA